MNKEEQQLKKLEAILNLVDDDKVSNDEFVQYFELVIDMVKANKEMTEGAIQRIETFAENAVARLTEQNSADRDALETRFRELIKTVKNGKDGLDGIDGRDGRDGKDGRDGRDGKDGSPDMAEDIRNKLELLEGDERLDKKAIKGLEEMEADVKKAVSQSATRVVGGASPLFLSVDGVKKSQTRYINFVAGSGITLSHANANSSNDITISTSGSGGILTATGTVNGVNADFTFTQQPSYIISDNVTMRATTKGGTVNWTWNSGTLTATLTIPPVDEIFGVV